MLPVGICVLFFCRFLIFIDFFCEFVRHALVEKKESCSRGQFFLVFPPLDLGFGGALLNIGFKCLFFGSFVVHSWASPADPFFFVTFFIQL